MMKILTMLFTLIFLFSACTSNKDKELLDSASTKAKANNFTGAFNDYLKIIKEYSGSESAAKSIFAVAMMYQSYRVPNISKEGSLRKAVEYYNKLFREFPDDKNAPKALFMVGFIQANELNQIDAARLSYQQFLEKYPKDELALSAKSELANLGKTPEEIIQENSKKAK